MPEHEIPDDEMAELRALAPTGLAGAAPRWPLAREEILHEAIATPHGRTSSWLPRLAIAAAAALTVGGIGLGLSRQAGTAVPAAPASPPVASASASASTDRGVWRTIPAGQYLVRTATFTQTTPGAAPDVTIRHEWLDAKLSWFMRDSVAGHEGTTTDVRPSRGWVVGMPTEPKAMNAWFLARRTKDDQRTAARAVWQDAGDLLHDPATSPDQRRRLVAMLALDPDTTVTRTTLAGRPVLQAQIRHRMLQGNPTRPVTMTESVTLDRDTMALLAQHQRSVDDAGHLVVDWSARFTEPEHLSPTHP